MNSFRADIPGLPRRRDPAPKSLVKRLRSSRAYIRTMRAWRRRHPICQRCGLRASTETHHKVPVHEAPELVLAFSNLLAVCGPCHEAIHAEIRPDPPADPPPQEAENRGDCRTARGAAQIPADYLERPATVPAKRINDRTLWNPL